MNLAVLGQVWIVISRFEALKKLMYASDFLLLEHPKSREPLKENTVLPFIPKLKKTYLNYNDFNELMDGFFSISRISSEARL